MLRKAARPHPRPVSPTCPRQVDLIFQFEHGGDMPRQLRKKLESLVAAAKDEDLARLTRVLEALVH